MTGHRLVGGREYLGLVTTLLQRARLAHPTAGLWEAGDLQWWWRTPRDSDDVGQSFWFDADGTPEAAVIFTKWGSGWGCDPIALPGAGDHIITDIWAVAIGRIAELGIAEVATAIRDDDTLRRELAMESGFRATAAKGVATWMDAAARPPVAPLADGFRLRDRSTAGTAPHHMIARNGRAVAERLAETSLYRPGLDLNIEAPDGSVAGYAMFWHDPVTGVGLVEPMRTEDRFQRRGLARHLLTAGLDRLAAAGAQRLKISYETDNEAARSLYLGTGFRRDAASTEYARIG